MAAYPLAAIFVKLEFMQTLKKILLYQIAITVLEYLLIFMSVVATVLAGTEK